MQLYTALNVKGKGTLKNIYNDHTQQQRVRLKIGP
jgi:hypothetical protein